MHPDLEVAQGIPKIKYESMSIYGIHLFLPYLERIQLLPATTGL
jgi:hypothetical protein